MSLQLTSRSSAHASNSLTDTLWWRDHLDGPIRTGHVVDRCPTGVAFMYTGDEPPVVGTQLNAAHADPRDPLSTPYSATVSRVVRLHAGMHLIAATFAAPRAQAA